MKKGRRREKEDPNNTWNMQLMAAVKGGNKDEVDVLLEKGAELDHFVKEGDGDDEVINTPLSWRVRSLTDSGMMVYLLEKKANINFVMERGMTALHHCVANDAMDTVELLMGHNPDTSIRDAMGFTPVQLAFHNRQVEMAQLLLKHGAFHDFRERNHGPYNLTQQACVSGDLVLLEALLDLGESVHQKDLEGNSLVHLAAKNDHNSLVEELIARRANVNAVNVYGRTPLWDLLETEKLDQLSFLAGRGADVNLPNGAGMTLLQAAVFAGNREAALLLLQLGARIGEVDSMGNTPLHWAASSRYQGVLDLLLHAAMTLDPKGGADQPVAEINLQTKEGNTPLHKACYWGRAELINMLLPKDADPTIANNRGRTPLHECAENGHVEAVLMLLNFKPGEAAQHDNKKGKKAPKGKAHEEVEIKVKTTEIEAEDNGGLTALQVAMDAEQNEVVDVLIKHGANVQRPSLKHGTLVHHALALGNQGIVASLITGGADINCRDGRDMTTLHLAVETGNLSICKYLLENGVDKDAADDARGLTALHMATTLKNSEIANLLIETGCDLEIVDKKKRTALHFASESGADDIALALLNAGAAINAREMHERTPLHVACEYLNPQNVKLLLAEGGDIEARDCHGWSPLHVAVHSGCTDSTTLLIDDGCLLNEPDYTHRTPLVLASQSGKVKCGQILVERFKLQNKSPQEPAMVMA